MTRLLWQPGSDRTAGSWLRAHLSQEKWSEFTGVVAFVKAAGLRQLRPELDTFAGRGTIRLAVGVDHRATTEQGLRELLAACPDGDIVVFHNESRGSTFHPKLFAFSSGTKADVLIGSSNLTAGGLETNYELSVELSLDLRTKEGADTYDEVHDIVNAWSDPASGMAFPLTEHLIEQLVARGYVGPEVFDPGRADADGEGGTPRPPDRPGPDPLFRSEFFAPPRRAASARRPAGRGSAAAAAVAPGPRGFVMTLQNTDVGVGQTTQGTARRSPEVFIPLGARDKEPRFWAWPAGYVDVPGKPHIKNRDGVRLRFLGSVAVATFMVNDNKRDLRIRSEAVRSAGNVGDVLVVERADPRTPFDYYVQVVPQGTGQYATYRALCVNRVRGNSLKEWGYY